MLSTEMEKDLTILNVSDQTFKEHTYVTVAYRNKSIKENGGVPVMSKGGKGDKDHSIDEDLFKES